MVSALVFRKCCVMVAVVVAILAICPMISATNRSTYHHLATHSKSPSAPVVEEAWCVCVLKTPSSVCLYVSAVDQYSQSLIAPRIIGTDQWGDCMSRHTWTTLLFLFLFLLFLSTEDTLLVTALDDCLGSGSSNSSSHRAGRLIEKPRRNGGRKEGRKDARMQFGKEVDASGNGNGNRNGNGNWRQDKWLSINLLTVM